MTRTALSALIVFSAVFFAACGGVRYSPSEISSYPSGIQEHIKKGEVALGMTPLEVRYTWGAPDVVRIPGAGTDGRFREIWVYRTLGVFAKRLVFVDGKLSGIISGLSWRRVPFEGDIPGGEIRDEDAAAPAGGEK
jgi:hypothetical protein